MCHYDRHCIAFHRLVASLPCLYRVNRPTYKLPSNVFAFGPLRRRTRGRSHTLPAPVDRNAFGWNQACLSSYINYALNTRARTPAYMHIRIGYGQQKPQKREGKRFCLAAVASCRRAIEIVDCACDERNLKMGHDCLLVCSRQCWID